MYNSRCPVTVKINCIIVGAPIQSQLYIGVLPYSKSVVAYRSFATFELNHTTVRHPAIVKMDCSIGGFPATSQ